MRSLGRRAILFRPRGMRGLGVIVQAPTDDGATFAANQGAQAQYVLPSDGGPLTISNDTLQQMVLALKQQGLQNAGDTIRPDLIPIGGVMPADARPIVQAAAVGYPAAGANARVVLAYTPAAGTVLVITQLSITHIGGNPPDFQGNVIWRLLIDNAWVKGMEMMQYQTGTQAAPAQISPLIVQEGQQFQVTVEVPAGQIAPGGGTATAARFLGYTYAMSRLQQGGS